VNHSQSEPLGSAELIIKLAPVAIAFESAEHRSVQACAAGLGISVAALHPSTSDPELASYLVAQVDPAAIDRVIEQLVACDGVEGAYTKPAGAPPEGSEHHAR
jgi:hypothetical protein